MAWYHKNKGLAGAAVGFAAGSIVPGLGNVIGAIAGAFVGPMVINDEPSDEVAVKTTPKEHASMKEAAKKK